MDSTWMGLARRVDGVVSIAGAVTELPDTGQHSRVLLIEEGRPLLWAEFPPGGLNPTAVSLKFDAGWSGGGEGLDLSNRSGSGIAYSSVSKEISDLTIAVCTRDRPEQLERCLISLRRLRGIREILVVDNASKTMEAADVVRRHQGGEVAIRRVIEPRPGLSHARNRALASATSSFVAFTDDDAVVDAEWPASLMRGFEEGESVALVTGLVLPRELASEAQARFQGRVRWSSNLCRSVYRLEDASQHEWAFPYAAGHFGTGANFAVRSNVILELGGFDLRLGAGRRTEGGEDLEMFVRVIRAGYNIVYEPTAIVWHQHRWSSSEFRRLMYGYGKGLSATVVAYFVHGAGPSALGTMCKATWNVGTHRRDATRGAGSMEGLGAEAVGIVVGPFAYLYEWFKSREC